MESHLKWLLDDKLFEKNLLAMCEYFCRMTSSRLKPSSTRELSWLSLARLVRKCDSDMLKKVSSRLQKRVVDLGKQPTTAGTIHFFSAVLSCLPSLKRFNAEAFSMIIGDMIDFAVQSRDKELQRAAAYAFALYGDNAFDELLHSSLRCCLSNSIEVEIPSSGAIKFSTCRQRNDRVSFVFTMFAIHSKTLRRHLPGALVSVTDWLEVARSALQLNVDQVSCAVFEWLELLIIHAGCNAVPASKQITSLFTDFLRPSDEYYQAFSRFYSFIGPCSTAVPLLPLIMDSIGRPWHLQEFASSFSKAVASIFSSHIYLLKPHEVISAQKIICEEALRFPESPVALHIFSALLGMSHELVPSPAQMGHSLYSRLNSNRKASGEMECGRSFCACLSRPKAQLVPNFEKWSHKMEEILHNISKDTVNYPVVSASNPMEQSPNKTLVEERGTSNEDPTIAVDLEKKMNLDAINLKGMDRFGKTKRLLLLKDESVPQLNSSGSWTDCEVSAIPNVFVAISENESELFSVHPESKLNSKMRKSDQEPSSSIVGRNPDIVGKERATAFDDGTADDDCVIIEEKTHVHKRKLINIWDGETNSDDVTPPKKPETSRAAQTAFSGLQAHGSEGFLTAEQMLEDLITD